MDKQLGKEFKNPGRTVAFLKDNCDKVEEKGYMKKYTPEEIQAMKEELAETSIKINDLATEKKNFMANLKIRMNPLAEIKGKILDGIKNKSRYVNEQCFKFVDMENRETGFYNSDGDLIDSRTATADELQNNIFGEIRKTGTHN